MIQPMLQLGMCIMEHSEVPEYSGIFISNPEYQILFRNNLLGAKRADHTRGLEYDQQSHDLLICLLRHYAVP